MKKAFILIFTIIFAALCLTGCGGNGAKKSGGKLKVVATVFPAYDFARQIAGDCIDLQMLLAPETESHGFEPTLKDLAVIQDCDVFIYIGGESEGWVDDVLASLETENITAVRLMDYVKPLEERIVEGMEAEEEESESSEPEYDEHIWTSPRNVIDIVSALTEILSERDAANAGTYAANSGAYTENLAQLDAQLDELTANSRLHTIVFAERFPFAYLANHYGLDYYAAFPGCASDTEPSLATISFLCDKINSEQIPVVFYIEFSKAEVADTICGATGAKKLLLHSCHNLTQEEFDAGVTYLDLMQQNIINLGEALN